MPVNEYRLPDVGEGLTEAEIVSWKVKAGDTVEVNDVVVEIETAKSLVELPSPYAGTVAALLVLEGSTVAVGTPILAVASGEDAAADDERQPTLVGYGPRTTQATRRVRKGGATPGSAAGSVAQQAVQGAFTPGATEEPVPEPDEPAVPATPAADVGQSSAPAVLAKPPVRKLAKDLGVDLRSVTPTGPNSTITRADVEAFPGALTGALTGRPPGPLPGREAEPDAVRERREAIKGVRKAMAQAMVASAFTAPHVTEWLTVDVTRTVKYLEAIRTHRDFRDRKVSPLLLVAKAVCLAVRRTPVVNAAWDEPAQEVVYRDYVNLGIAAATGRGLVVPNVKDADRLSLAELADALEDLTRTARQGRTQPAQMTGGTFTITNVGVFGVDAGTPILNPGESAILCLGAVRRQPWVRNGKVRPRWVTTLALSFDHRLVDGQMGSRFLADVAAVLEEPANALLY